MHIKDIIVDILTDTALDGLKMLPFLFGAYLLLEWIEHRSSSKLRHRLSHSGRYSVPLGAAIGLIPQCGFSVAASNLFAVHGSCMEEELLDTGMEYIRRFLKKVDNGNHLRIIGPAYEPVSKIADMYRKVLYVKHEDLSQLLKIKEKLERYLEINSGFNKIRILFQLNQ